LTYTVRLIGAGGRAAIGDRPPTLPQALTATAQATMMPIVLMCMLDQVLLSKIVLAPAAVTFTVDPRGTLSESEAAF
jgi:hypothetical protein